MATGYERIKKLAKSRGCTIPDLLALARQNDPYFAGSPTGTAMAEWFAGLWEQFGYTSGVHLRRVHYQLVSGRDAWKHNGLPYENTEKDWDYLGNAGKYARYLGLVDPEAFVDRRNPDPHIFAYVPTSEAPTWEFYFANWDLPRISKLESNLDWDLPTWEVHGYDYAEANQPYHLELWAEKSTMNDVLIPICKRLGVNLITGVGFMSITSVNPMLLERLRRLGKPCRIFYVSDFDPAGSFMPTAVARQIEYWSESAGHEFDVKLEPIVLTREQMGKYRLPRIPVKDSDRRKANFEERYGEGAVELDALEALHPGELAKIVEARIAEFRDPELEDRMSQAAGDAEAEIAAVWDKEIEPFRKQLTNLKRRVRPVIRKYNTRLEALGRELEKELAPYQRDLDSLRQAIQEAIDRIEVSLPEMPEPEVYPDDDDWLFDSDREYFEQLAAYKVRKNGAQK